MRKLTTLSALAIALIGSPAFAADLQGYECSKNLDERIIQCGPWKDNKPNMTFENVTDIYAKGYRVVISYFVAEHKTTRGTTSSIYAPHYAYIIEKQ